MKRKILLILFSAAALFFGGFNSQTVRNEEGGTPADKPAAGAQFTETFNLADLGFKEALTLNGPYQEVTAQFSLPPDWETTGDMQLQLQLQVEFQSLMEAFTSEDAQYQPANQGGTLLVMVNGILAAQAMILESGEQSLTFTLPADLLKENMAVNEIILAWDAAAACLYDVTSYITIAPASSILINYQEKISTAALADFPKPFFEHSLLRAYPTALVVMDAADSDVLSTLMAVSAGLGRQSAGGMTFNVFNAEQTRNMDLTPYHLILVGLKNNVDDFLAGQADDFDREIALAEKEQEAGYLWMGRSLWNAGRAMLVVTGEDGQALKKAGAVIAGGSLPAYAGANLAVIADLPAEEGRDALKVDYNLGDLLSGSQTLRVEQLGSTNVKITFYVPGDLQVTAESYLEIYFRHSQLLNYLRSGLSVSLNGRKIGTIRFSDNSSENGLARIILPPNIIHPQKNELELAFTLTGQDLCADERSGDYWVTIFDESYLHLPPELLAETGGKKTEFNNLPWMFLEDEQLADLTFISLDDDFTNWQRASQLAYALGSYTSANVLTPSAADLQSLLAEAPKGNFILLGRWDAIPEDAPINRWLPLPFNAQTAMDRLTIDGTQFSIADGRDYGILESGSDPESGNRILAVLGNSPESLEYAFNALKEMLTAQSGASANLLIIDSQDHVYEFLIEQPADTQDAGEARKTGWLERVMAASGNQMAVYLLAVVGSITIVFLVWLISGRRRRRQP